MQKVQILENNLRRLKLQLRFCSITSIDYVLLEIEQTEKLITKAKYELKKTKIRTGFIVMTFFLALLSPAFFLFATLFLGAANSAGAFLCTIAMLVAAMAADYSSKQVNKYK